MYVLKGGEECSSNERALLPRAAPRLKWMNL